MKWRDTLWPLKNCLISTCYGIMEIMKTEIETKDGLRVEGKQVCERPLKGTVEIVMKNGLKIEGRKIYDYPLK